MKVARKKHKRHQKKKNLFETKLFFLKRNLQKVKKDKNISTPNEKTTKKNETWKTYGNNEKRRQLRK